jgi:hypothetical protein
MQPTAADRPAASIFFDADGDRLVAAPIEIREDGRRRRERHFVLAGSTAVENADTKTLHASPVGSIAAERGDARVIIG